MDKKELLLCFKALADDTRLKIIDILQSGSKCACILLEAFDITQPTLSYHMKLLVDSGLVMVEKRGTWNHYSLNNDMFDKLGDIVKELS